MQLTKPLLSEKGKEDKERIIKIVRLWGGATSDAILDPLNEIFLLPNIEGLISYRIEKNCAIVFGDPVCAFEAVPTFTTAFHDYCKNLSLNIIYVAASEKFTKWAMNNVCQISIQFGVELTIDPHNDPRAREGVKASLVRRKVRHATHEGTTVSEYHPEDAALERKIEEVGETWLRARRGPQVHISNVYLFANRTGKRWFYAKKGDQIVGALALNQLEEKKGWLLNHLMHIPDAPHGTPELLVVTALESLKQENCHYVTFGPVVGYHLQEIDGLGKISSWCLRKLFTAMGKVLRLDGRKQFWDKFHPDSQHLYLLFDQPSIGLGQLLALMRALNIRYE